MSEDTASGQESSISASTASRDRSGDALTVFSIAQQLGRKHWKWDAEDKKQLGTAAGVLGVIKRRFKEGGYEFEGLYGIIHDRDTEKVYDGQADRVVVAKKAKHVHVVAKLSGGKISLGKAAELAGVTEQYVEKPHSGRYSYENMLAYLVHAKSPDKYPYYEDPELIKKVATAAGEDYAKVYATHKDSWARVRARNKMRSAGDSVEWLRERVLSGEVSMSQIVENDGLFLVYSQNRSAIDEALDLYKMRRAYRENEELESGGYECSVIFISGQAGAGKTTFAGALVSYLEKAYGWDTAHLAATNSLDDYRAERIMLLDDVRFENAMTASSWLNLLDRHHASRSSRRYHNSPFRSKPRVIIITSKAEPLEFFYLARKSSRERTENLDQFIRRLTLHVRILDHGEFGDYRFELEEPIETGAHTEHFNTTDHDNASFAVDVPDLRYALRTPEEYTVGGKVGRYTPWNAMEAVADRIAKANSNAESCLGEPDASMGFLEAAYRPIEALAFPKDYTRRKSAIAAHEPEELKPYADKWNGLDLEQVAPLTLRERQDLVRLVRRDGYTFTFEEARKDCKQAMHAWAAMCGDGKPLEDMLAEFLADLRQTVSARCAHLGLGDSEKDALMGMLPEVKQPSGDTSE